MIKARSTVKHIPTGEEWLILGTNKNKDSVCVAGWPPTKAHLSDCVFVKDGKELTKEEIEYRTKEFGTDWD